MRRWTSTSSAAPRPSPAPSSCSSPTGPASSSTAGCSRAARTSRSGTGSRSPSTPATLDAVLLTHAHLDHCGLLPLWSSPRAIAGPIHATRRRRSSWRARPARLGQAPGGVREARGPLGEAPPRRGRGRRPEGGEAYQAAVDAGRGRRGAGTEAGTPRPPTARVQRRRGDAAAAPTPATIASEATSDDGRARPTPAGPAPVGQGRRDPEADLRAPAAARSTSTSTSRSTRPRTPRRRWRSSRPIDYGEELEVAPGHPRHVRRRRPHPRLGDHPAPRRGSRGRRGADDRLLAATSAGPDTPILRDPTIHDRRRLRPRRVDLRRPRARARGRGDPDPRRDRPAGRRRTAACCSSRRSRSAGRRRSSGSSTGCIERGEIPLLPLYLDSPMASKASDIYRHHPDYYDEETAEAPARRRHAARLPEPDRHATTSSDSQAIAHAPRPYMIVASNGMLTGGRVVGHLRNLIDDPTRRSCSSATRARARSAPTSRPGANEVKLDGQVREVRCQIRSISGFSAHADEGELLDWLGHFAAGKQPGDRRLPADASSSSTATRRPRSRSSRRSARSASRRTSRTGTSASRSTDRLATVPAHARVGRARWNPGHHQAQRERQ